VEETLIIKLRFRKRTALKPQFHGKENDDKKRGPTGALAHSTGFFLQVGEERRAEGVKTLMLERVVFEGTRPEMGFTKEE